MGWNPGILAGISVPHRPDLLFNDMHSYLAAAGGWRGREGRGVQGTAHAGAGVQGSISSLLRTHAARCQVATPPTARTLHQQHA